MPVDFVLFDIWPELVTKWREAFEALVPSECLEHITFIDGGLDALNMPFDCIVSPANSFGRFDGGFDQILSERLAPADDEDALTRTAQSVLYKRWRGFAPPGTCTLIPLSHTPCAANPFRCRFVALCPTMRLPGSVTWHREIVYNCVWSLLVEIDEHNARAEEEGSGQVRTVVMTGLATGIGRIPAGQCAKQMALAFAHYYEAKRNPDKWSALSWRDIGDKPLNPRLPMDE